MVHPIIDEYYSYNPYHSRSSKFVQDKGLVTNEKGGNASSRSLSPATTPGISQSNESKRLGQHHLHGPSHLHDSIDSIDLPFIPPSLSMTPEPLPLCEN
jgi:glutamine amidotransferase